MKITSSKSVSINLSLTEEEAIWLMEFVHNHPESGSEHSVEAALRKSLFEGLMVSIYPDKVPAKSTNTSR